ncbi:hypothetical protein BDP27DRAFT_1436645 [Rhodocollybia butyracea]|uniref:Uncharacterized protein n=1 Tax=Rhodocollybia butyracea TaxID=206335 RepID=A0A9P5P589_9AGAR|nr:hypothetical protein BDP27DRAFT_1436645 [Rhodocollybia butyracea]
MKLVKAGVTAAAGVVGVIGGISTVAFPPALLILPVILPLLLFMADFLELKNTKLIKELKIEEQELHGAIVKLKEASKSLNVMTGHVNDCTNFWMGIELNLNCINGRLAELNPVNNQPHLINAKRTLKEAKAEYKKYYTELKKLRTLYMPTIGAASCSSEEAILITSSATSSQSSLT